MRIQIGRVILMLSLVTIVKREVIDRPIEGDRCEIRQQVTHEVNGC